jgi:hypothetical protein
VKDQLAAGRIDVSVRVLLRTGRKVHGRWLLLRLLVRRRDGRETIGRHLKDQLALGRVYIAVRVLLRAGRKVCETTKMAHDGT